MNYWRFARIVLPPLVPLVVLVVVMEIAVRREWVKPYVVAAPSQIVHEFRENWRNLFKITFETATSAFIGFALSTVIGIASALVLSSFNLVRRALYPYTVFFQTVPIVAIAPMLVIWLDLEWTVPASAFIVSVFPVIANTLSGLLSTDPALRDLFKLYGADPVATFFKLRLPYALPSILTGLRIAAGLAVVGAIVGEFVSGGGIGDDIIASRQQGRIARVFADLLLSAILGILLFALINLISRLTLRHWHASEAGN